MPYPSNFPFARESHEIYPLFNDNPKLNFRCRVCGSVWERKPQHGTCVGVKIYYEWEDVPKGLFSETALYRDHKRKLPEGTYPLAAKRSEMNTFIPLYALEQANPDYKGKKAKTKAKATPKAEKAEEKINWKEKPERKSGPFDWLQEVKRGDSE
jgi:hypothetical protein